MLVGSVGFIYFHFLRPLPPPRANKELYFYVHYFRTIFEFLSPILEGRFLWEWWLFRIFLRTKLSFFLTERQSQSYRKHWKETQEKERRKVRAVSTKCRDNAQLRTVSLFSWYVEQNVWDTHYDHARDWRHEMGEARKRRGYPLFLLGPPPSFFASLRCSRARALTSQNLKKRRDCSL